MIAPSRVSRKFQEASDPELVVVVLCSVLMCVALWCDVLPLVRWFLDVQWPT